jgi:hypothetical protein
MREQVRPDDAVRRFPAVWLGPDDMTLPAPVRYSALGLWLAAVTAGGIAYLAAARLGLYRPTLIGVVWLLCLATLATYAVMRVVDSDLPLPAVAAVAVAEARSAATARPDRPAAVVRTARHVRIINR